MADIATGLRGIDAKVSAGSHDAVDGVSGTAGIHCVSARDVISRTLSS
jgi:hypothetical protein